jgi:hypothetical protein
MKKTRRRVTSKVHDHMDLRTIWHPLAALRSDKM